MGAHACAAYPLDQRLIKYASPSVAGMQMRAAADWWWLLTELCPGALLIVQVKCAASHRRSSCRKPYGYAVMSVFVKTEKERPRRCFLCVGKALSLAPDDPEAQDLIHEFYTSGDLSKHFRRKHLSNLRDGDEIECQDQ
ncbi:hypothetical protein BGZ61DRAFT_487177 [Ilyonectria robusta]|uniref:uncharacterized protein n=1 Tax=Ilyonectria robusta TaxID=1079257 RepID=UPI001E8DB452|nr:uncharacterized protein BGZ61DRAFT_487177 [Ilyonectria robusta]KAH8654222.1 hypothetical protein BGZ61DRAFT_487177 [Ilyonectria robusta]